MSALPGLLEDAVGLLLGLLQHLLALLHDPARLLEFVREVPADLVDDLVDLLDVHESAAHERHGTAGVHGLLDAVDHDPIWLKAATAMNAYGSQGRFYWLDALSGSPQLDDTPAGYWEKVFNTARDASPELTALFHQAFKSNEAHVEYMLRLNHAAADSIEQWWAMVTMAGTQGVFGERGRNWGLDQHIVPRQVRDTPN